MGSSTQSASFTKNTSFMRNFLKVYGVVDRSSLDMVRTSHLRNEEKVFLAAYLNKNKVFAHDLFIVWFVTFYKNKF